MLSCPNFKQWCFSLTLLAIAQSPATAQNAGILDVETQTQPAAIDALPSTLEEPFAEFLEPAPEPYRGYLIELIVFENTQHIELGKQDNNDYSLPDDRPTNRSSIYPSIPDELYTHLARLQLNTLYQPIAYTTWRQISKPRGESPYFQLNEISPSLTGTITVYDNVILLTELEVEYNPALGSAATDISILDIPEPVAFPDENTALAADNQNIVANRVQNRNPGSTSEQAPYTGKFYPAPYSNAQAYIYRRVSHQSARYLINEKRRVKFEETHYFDHPAFGILLRVIRTEIPVDEYNLSTVEALGIPPFSTPQSVENDPINVLDSRSVSPATPPY